MLYRKRDGVVQVFLVHPGGPYWKNRDRHAWSMPKGLFGEDEAPREAAKREFYEETGHRVREALHPLGTHRASGKTVHAFAAEQDMDTESLDSNTFTMEWPPNSGREREFPEIDKGRWFGLDDARERIHKNQAMFLDRLADYLDIGE